VYDDASKLGNSLCKGSDKDLKTKKMQLIRYSNVEIELVGNSFVAGYFLLQHMR